MIASSKVETFLRHGPAYNRFVGLGERGFSSKLQLKNQLYILNQERRCLKMWNSWVKFQLVVVVACGGQELCLRSSRKRPVLDLRTPFVHPRVFSLSNKLGHAKLAHIKSTGSLKIACLCRQYSRINFFFFFTLCARNSPSWLCRSFIQSYNPVKPVFIK